MYKKIVSTFAAAFAAVLTGCTMTSSLMPPAPENAAVSPRSYMGKWICSDDSDNYNIAVTEREDTKNHIAIQIVQTQKKPQKDFAGQWAPLAGYFFKAGGKTFLACYTDVKRLIADTKYNGSAMLMLSTRYYLLQVMQENTNGLTLRFVSFIKDMESKEKKAIPGSRLKYYGNGIVVNTTDEIYSFLKKGEYVLEGDTYRLTRKR